MEKINWENVRHETPEWFRDAKFGIFFHWGPYSVPACMNEWYSRNMYAKGLEQNKYHEKTYGKLHDFGYKDFYPMFKGEKFDADVWADLVVKSGAKYAGPVTEHADNFSLWDSKENSVNAVNYGPHRDVVGECEKAFRKRGIKFITTFHHQWLWGWFMSTDNEADVYEPANEKYYGPALPLETNRYEPYRYPDEAFCKKWYGKVEEVIDKYKPDMIYFDSRSFIIDEKYRYGIADYYYNQKGFKDGLITYKQEDFPKGIGTYDIECGKFSLPKPFPWQSDDRLEDNITWCIVQNPKYKSAKRIIHQLCDIVSKNGNLLLNVGPCADGSFHPDAVKELEEIGNWLKLNGEAIYGTRPFVIAGEGPTIIEDAQYDIEKINKQLNDGGAVDVHSETLSEFDIRFTTKGDVLYAIVMGWPEDGNFTIKSLAYGNYVDKEELTVEMLGAGPLTWTRDNGGLHIQAPLERPCKHAYVIKIS